MIETEIVLEVNLFQITNIIRQRARQGKPVAYLLLVFCVFH